MNFSKKRRNAISKKITLLLIFLISLNSCNSDDEPQCDNGTFVGDVFLKNQTEVDEFGTKCYSKVRGKLIIGVPNVPTDITDLSSLINLKEVEIGHLGIYADKIIDLNGLNNITKFGGLRIIRCNDLTSLNGLNNLKEVGNIPDGTDIDNNYDHSLRITQCHSLISIEALANLTAVEGLTLGGLYLESLDGLENLMHVSQNGIQIGADFPCLDNAPCSINPNLKDFCALQNLFINGDYDLDNVFLGIFSSISVQDIIDGNCKQ